MGKDPGDDEEGEEEEDKGGRIKVKINYLFFYKKPIFILMRENNSSGGRRAPKQQLRGRELRLQVLHVISFIYIHIFFKKIFISVGKQAICLFYKK